MASASTDHPERPTEIDMQITALDQARLIDALLKERDELTTKVRTLETRQREYTVSRAEHTALLNEFEGYRRCVNELTASVMAINHAYGDHR